jgi:hypothetical protein
MHVNEPVSTQGQHRSEAMKGSSVVWNDTHVVQSPGMHCIALAESSSP